VDQIATALWQVDTADKVTRVRRSAKAPTVCGQNMADGHPELGRLDGLPLRMRVARRKHAALPREPTPIPTALARAGVWSVSMIGWRTADMLEARFRMWWREPVSQVSKSNPWGRALRLRPGKPLDNAFIESFNR